MRIYFLRICQFFKKWTITLYGSRLAKIQQVHACQARLVQNLPALLSATPMAACCLDRLQVRSDRCSRAHISLAIYQGWDPQANSWNSPARVFPLMRTSKCLGVLPKLPQNQFLKYWLTPQSWITIFLALCPLQAAWALAGTVGKWCFPPPCSSAHSPSSFWWPEALKPTKMYAVAVCSLVHA